MEANVANALTDALQFASITDYARAAVTNGAVVGLCAQGDGCDNTPDARVDLRSIARRVFAMVGTIQETPTSKHVLEIDTCWRLTRLGD